MRKHQNMKRTVTMLIITSLTAITPTITSADQHEATAGNITVRGDDALGQQTVLIDGQEAITYQYGTDKDGSRWGLPHFYPLCSPSGKSMTVQITDPYPHHRAFWFGDTVQLEGSRRMSTYNAYYSWADKKDPSTERNDRVRHLDFENVDAKDVNGQTEINYREQLVWEMDCKTPVLDEQRDVRIVPLGNGEYLMDIKFTLTASHGDVKFVSDDVHYAWPYVRMNKTFSVEGGNGTITNSEGQVNQKETHNQEAKWIDYSAKFEDGSEGLTLFSHPENPGPHRWLTRDYGTFGPRRHNDRSGKPFTLKQGESISQRVGVLVHRGDVTSGKVEQRFEAYASGEL